ncbi:MAG TPA: nuclear transport factor 2 family protein [Pyrinomonadaceae bacterium]|nr:nuclear transport factor 2 family protein [Pyrinomonadaceae bacterium]
MSEQENLEVVRNLFERFASGDLPGILGMLADGVDWHIRGPEVVPFYGPRAGHDGVLDFFGKVSTSVAFDSFQPEEFIPAGDKVLVIGGERGRVRATGRSFENSWIMVFTLRDGKITKFRSYEDTAAVAEAFKTQ